MHASPNGRHNDSHSTRSRHNGIRHTYRSSPLAPIDSVSVPIVQAYTQVDEISESSRSHRSRHIGKGSIGKEESVYEEWPDYNSIDSTDIRAGKKVKLLGSVCSINDRKN